MFLIPRESAGRCSTRSGPEGGRPVEGIPEDCRLPGPSIFRLPLRTGPDSPPRGAAVSRPEQFHGGGCVSSLHPCRGFSPGSRSEFYTAYTHINLRSAREHSRGSLNIRPRLPADGMEVSNASMYDGASSLAEAVLMANRVTKRRKVLLSEAVHPSTERWSGPISIPGNRKSFRFLTTWKQVDGREEIP